MNRGEQTDETHYSMEFLYGSQFDYKQLCYLYILFSGNGLAIQDTLSDMTGLRTVPNVFVNGQHVGELISVHYNRNRNGQCQLERVVAVCYKNPSLLWSLPYQMAGWLDG